MKEPDFYGMKGYQNGDLVRLISGVIMGGTTIPSPVPGYHPSKGWKTVCSIQKERECQIGFKDEELIPVSNKTTISTGKGNVVSLSSEIYQITRMSMSDETLRPKEYRNGRYVRLISWITHEGLGFHTSPGFKTVCSISATTAEWIGIPENCLVKVEV